MLNKFLIRAFDLFFSFLGLLFLLPLFVVISLIIIIESKGGPFFIQKRVGLNGKLFGLIKFRTMYIKSDLKGLITVGKKDPRVTRIGVILRTYKIDELSQLLNVLKGDMSLVGPRPEVLKYVDLYTDEQRKVLNIKPGITDYASIAYANENEILAKAGDPEEYYIRTIMPAKLKLNEKYINNRNLSSYFKIIFRTIFRNTSESMSI